MIEFWQLSGRSDKGGRVDSWRDYRATGQILSHSLRCDARGGRTFVTHRLLFIYSMD